MVIDITRSLTYIFGSTMHGLVHHLFALYKKEKKKTFIFLLSFVIKQKYQIEGFGYTKLI